MLNIIAIESNKGYYISIHPLEYNNPLLYRLFDGIKGQLTFHRDWLLIPNKPSKVSRIEKQGNINHRFILKDDTLKGKIPLEIIKDNAGHYEINCEDNRVFVWKPELDMYKSLYEEVSDEQPDKEIIEDFSFDIILKINDINIPPKFLYTASPINITSNDIKHQILDQILFPSLIIHETPCRLSSEDTYKIVRKHIQENINPKVAKITSDYDFCFEVSKIVPLAKPYNREYKPLKRNRYHNPKVETILVSNKFIKIFEMTHDRTKYQGYTPIDGFEADNESELKQNIDDYLKNLMDYINEPLKECHACNGTGVLLNKDVEPVTAKHSTLPDQINKEG